MLISLIYIKKSSYINNKFKLKILVTNLNYIHILTIISRKILVITCEIYSLIKFIIIFHVTTTKHKLLNINFYV